MASIPKPPPPPPPKGPSHPSTAFTNLRSPRPINIVINIPVGDLVSYSADDFSTLERAISRLERAIVPATPS